MRRSVVRLASGLAAMLLVALGALLWTLQAQAQEPCTVDGCIDKTATPDTVAVGEPVTFTVTERCIFPTAVCVNTLELTDAVPSAFTIDSVADSQPNYECSTSGNLVTCPGLPRFRTYSPANPFVLTIVATPTECGSFTNTALVGSPPRPDWREARATVMVACLPTTKEQCKNGGWRDFDYPNQGLCIKDVNLRRASSRAR
jgi:Domain of unknown function DUF11